MNGHANGYATRLALARIAVAGHRNRQPIRRLEIERLRNAETVAVEWAARLDAVRRALTGGNTDEQ